jgi:hypothetical protein
VGIPGTGIWSRTRIGGSHGRASLPRQRPVKSTPWPSRSYSPPRTPEPQQPSDPFFVEGAEQVHSAETGSLTSHGLEEFRELITSAHAEQKQLNQEIPVAKAECDAAERRRRKWESGFLFKRLRPARFVEITEEAKTAAAKVEELEEQLRLAKIATEINLPEAHMGAYARLCDDFVRLSNAQGIYDILAHQSINGAGMRTMAAKGSTTAPVSFGLGECDLIASKWQVPHLQNRNGGDLFLYPGFVLYRVSDEEFALIDFHEVDLETSTQKFIVQDKPESDAEVVGHTWYKTNKDGSPDRRFKKNFEMPIVRYGILKFKSQTGLNEEFLISNHGLTDAFGRSWAAFHSLVTPEGTATSTQPSATSKASGDQRSSQGSSTASRAGAATSIVKETKSRMSEEPSEPEPGSRSTLTEHDDLSGFQYRGNTSVKYDPSKNTTTVTHSVPGHWESEATAFTADVTVDNQVVGGKHIFAIGDSISFSGHTLTTTPTVVQTLIHGVDSREDWHFPPNTRLVFKIDGEVFDVNVKYQIDLVEDPIAPTKFTESLDARPPYEMYLKIATAKRVTVQVGMGFFDLDPRIIDSYRDFVRSASTAGAEIAPQPGAQAARTPPRMNLPVPTQPVMFAFAWPQPIEANASPDQLAVSREALRLATEKPRGWEYLLFAQVMLDEIRKAKRDLARGNTAPPEPSNINSMPEFLDWASSRVAEYQSLLSHVSEVNMTNDNPAFGPPGQPGNISGIVSLSRKVGYLCQRAADLSQNIAETPLPLVFHDVARELQRFSEVFIESGEKFAKQFLEKVQDAVTKPPGSRVVIDMTWKIDSPDQEKLQWALKMLELRLSH